MGKKIKFSMSSVAKLFATHLRSRHTSEHSLSSTDLERISRIHHKNTLELDRYFSIHLTIVSIHLDELMWFGGVVV